MAVVIDGTTGISTPAEIVLGNLSYTGTLTGNGGIVNLGSGQVYKDASGNVGIGTSSPTNKLHVAGTVKIQGSTLDLNDAGTFTISQNTTSSALVLRTAASSYMRFDTNGSNERMRLTDAGPLLIGTTSAWSTGVRFQVYGSASSFETAGTGGNDTVYFRNGNGIVGTISTSGSNTTYATSSDYRLKEAITPMTGALAKVALLKPCTYKWKVDGSDGQGFIAHELAEVEAGCVTGAKDAVDEDGNPQYQGIDTSFLVATLTAAIQEQQTLITALTARITALETAA